MTDGKIKIKFINLNMFFSILFLSSFTRNIFLLIKEVKINEKFYTSRMIRFLYGMVIMNLL